MTTFKPTDAMHDIGKNGVQRLKDATPRDTGETAAGWDYMITTRWITSDIVWFNRAHPELNVNIAKLIELGHGTGSGGYVAPRPYMRGAMDDVFNGAMIKIAREMTK